MAVWLHAPDVFLDGATRDSRRLRIVHISDTHSRLREFAPGVPPGDVLVHSGDFSTTGGAHEVRLFLNEFRALPHPHKILVAGNHDAGFDTRPPADSQRLAGKGVTYLHDSEVAIDGVRFYGCPWTRQGPAFRLPSVKLAIRFEQIPDDVDVLVTHLPPFNILDLALYPGRGASGSPGSQCEHCGTVHDRYEHWGSAPLLDAVRRRRIPLHLFGHVHEANGCRKVDGTVYANAAMPVAHRPVIVDLFHDRSAS